MKMNILNKLLAGFLTVVAITAGLGVFALMQLKGLNDNIVYIGTNSVPSVIIIGSIQADIDTYRQTQLQHVIADTKDQMDQYEQIMKEDEAEIQDLFKTYTGMFSNDADRASYEKIEKEWNQYVSKSSAFLEPSRNLDSKSAIEILNGDAKVDFDQLKKDLADWNQLNVDLANQQLEHSASDYAFSEKMVIGLLVGVSLIALGIGFFLARSISSAAKHMVKAAEEIAENDLATLSAATATLANGDLSQTIAFQTQVVKYKPSDEMGELAESFNRMIARLQETGNSFAQMTTQLRMSIGRIAENAESLGAASEQLATAANQAGQATGQISTTIQQVAKGTSQQSESVNRTASSVEQMSRAIDGVAKGAQDQTQAVGKAAQVTSQIANAYYSRPVRKCVN